MFCKEWQTPLDIIIPGRFVQATIHTMEITSASCLRMISAYILPGLTIFARTYPYPAALLVAYSFVPYFATVFSCETKTRTAESLNELIELTNQCRFIFIMFIFRE